jgi:hypothetical protein
MVQYLNIKRLSIMNSQLNCLEKRQKEQIELISFR